MAIDLGWARTGRAYAWLGAESFLVGAIILVLVNMGIGTPSATTGLAQYVNTTSLVVIGSGFLLLGMLTIIPVGLMLREPVKYDRQPPSNRIHVIGCNLHTMENVANLV